MAKEVLRMENIEKEFPGVKALKNAFLNLYEGEVLGLIGENGAGKSTLMNILGGIYRPDAGKIYIDGAEVSFKNVFDSQRQGIAFIHQELALVSHMTVGENIFLGRQLKKYGFISQFMMNEEAKKYLSMVGLDISPKTIVGDLSVGQQQMVEIAKALSINAKIIVMDEPTSSLSEKEVQILFDTVRKLKSQGVSIIYISHKMEEIFELTDRIIVMRDGNYVGTKITRETNREELIPMMVGRELKNYYVRTYNKIGEPVLKVKDISVEGKVYNCGFEVKKGEILGFYGLIGAGRSELMEAIIGLLPQKSGEVYINGQQYKNLTPLKSKRLGIVLVPEDRKLKGLILKNTISFNITITVLEKIINKLRVNKNVQKRIVDDSIKSLSIKTPSERQRVMNLSGGNQQKVVLAKWLATNPGILILDEPTRGIDVGAKAEIYKIINELAAQGIAVIMVSSELPELINMCDRIIVVREGRIAGEVMKEEFDQGNILRLAMGGV